MADVFLEPIIEMLISAGSRYLKDQVTWHKRTKEELQKLKGNLFQIQAVVHFASSQDQITDQNPHLNTWLWELRDAIDYAKEVLDELEFLELEKQVTKNKKLRRVRSILKFMKKKLVKIFKINRTLKRLEEAVQKLNRVSITGVDTFLHLVKHAKKELQKQQLELYGARETGPLPKSALNVRDKETKLVLEWVTNPSNEHRGTDLYRNISLLSIVGHGGMGKTTLLQHVYEDKITKEFFDLKMWVCVSNNFDVKKVIADMLESLKKERPSLVTLGELQNSLRTEMMSKKFLLVLDDVWDEVEGRDQSKWEDVLPSLASGAFGGKILVTTRTKPVALMFARVISQKMEIVNLEGLEEDACLQLLNSNAFAGVKNPSDDDHIKLRAIAGEIVKKLLGYPLAAKVIGVFLNENLDEGHWRTVLESNLLNQNSINSILRLSYIGLPIHLQNCFAVCCMFPQDHEFDKDDLVRMWIALGFIQPSEFMEVIGGRYFDVLVKKALLDKVEDDYKMHDLIHESASTFFEQECGKLEEPSLKFSETIRHLSVRTTKLDILRKIEKFKHLHSLFLFYKDSNQDLCSALIEIFKASKSLRLLHIDAPYLKMIPEEIENLIHLRYLKIDGYNLTMLPRSLSNLYHLQYIIYDESVRQGDDFLPSDINNLSNLRYMKLTKDCISSICGIGKLTSLQKLEMFDLRDVSGYRIEELENMNDLRKLGINCLENVKDAKEACSAKLCAKWRLTNLTLCWSNTDLRNIHLEKNVLDNLQPPECLRNLKIERYMGARFAIWMYDFNLIYNIEKIELVDCMECVTLPSFGQLPFLKSLILDNMPKVKCFESNFNCDFRSLEELEIYRLEELEDWFDGSFLRCLIQLKLIECPKLKELPSLPSKLKSLYVAKIGWTTLNFCRNSKPIPLESLVVIDCPNITSVPLADEIARLAALRYLTIRDCPNLISLGSYREEETTNNCPLILNFLWITDPSVLLMEPLKSIAYLQKLTIRDNNVLVSFPNAAEQWFLRVRSSLCELRFEWLKSLQSLPSSFESLSSLAYLNIQDIPMLRELPNLPPSLKHLSIGQCHPELKERYREDGGSDRHKIAHIPYIDISI